MWILDQQKDKKTLVIDSYRESEYEIHSVGECSFASAKEWIEDTVSWKLEVFIGVSSVTIECNNPQNVSEIIELVFDHNFFELVTSQTNLHH